MTDDLEWTVPVDDPTRPERTPRTCRHPRHRREIAQDGTGAQVCGSCGKQLDPARMARGRRANARGRRLQKKNMEAAGLMNIAGNVPGLDGKGGMFRGESKSGSAFPKLLYRFLQAIPYAAGQVPILVVRETPGRGRKAAAVVLMHLSDFRDLHGEVLRDSDEGIQPVDPYLTEKAG